MGLGDNQPERDRRPTGIPPEAIVYIGRLLSLLVIALIMGYEAIRILSGKNPKNPHPDDEENPYDPQRIFLPRRKIAIIMDKDESEVGELLYDAWFRAKRKGRGKSKKRPRYDINLYDVYEYMRKLKNHEIKIGDKGPHLPAPPRPIERPRRKKPPSDADR